MSHKLVSEWSEIPTLIQESVGRLEQKAHGVIEVRQAVGHIDQVTQQDPALVEKGAAAAANPNGQAQELVECDATFKTKKSEGTAPNFRPAAFSKQTRHQRKLRLTPATA